MRNTRWLGTTGFTLYDSKEREYIFYTDSQNENLNKPHTYREGSEGVEFVDLDGNIVFVPWGDMETEIE